MANLILWRRLTETDFNSINGHGAQSGTGGGAMHISLGTGRQIPINTFLSSRNHVVTIDTEPFLTSVPKAHLTFDGNPNRRNGDWRINDQYNHRHPAWTSSVGFPASYNSKNKPIVMVVRQDGKYHVRFSTESKLQKDLPSLSALISANSRKNSGIVAFSSDWAAALAIPETTSRLGEYERLADEVEKGSTDAFDPKDVEDGRRKIVAEVVRRQGQRKFRRELLEAYEKKCAVSGCTIEVTLEAAHITPYRGSKTNGVSNGLLLRGDIHTLFDLGLLTIDAETHRVRISSALADSDYATLDKKKIYLPKKTNSRPSSTALQEHMKIFQA
jgi:predicted restriction endonuclease